MFPGNFLSDATLLIIARRIDGRWTRRAYEEFLVELGIYSLYKLRETEEYANISKLTVTFLFENGDPAAAYDVAAL